MGNEKIVVGSDGKEVARQIPTFVTSELWYKKNETNEVTKKQKCIGLGYAAKRDPYANCDLTRVSRPYRPFKRTKPTTKMDATEKPIIDEYSKTVAVSSQRERGGIAHYLEDVPKLDFGLSISSYTLTKKDPYCRPINFDANLCEIPKLDFSGKESGAKSSVRAGPEDTQESNLKKEHQAVFGSYFESKRWGYKCCKSLNYGSHCSAA